MSFIFNFVFFVSQLFHEYTAETYQKFIQGTDTFEDEDETFVNKLSECSSTPADTRKKKYKKQFFANLFYIE